MGLELIWKLKFNLRGTDKKYRLPWGITIYAFQ